MEQLQAAIGTALLAASLMVWAVILWRIVTRQPVVEYEPRVPVPWSGREVFWVVLFWPLLELFVLRMSLSRSEIETHEVTPEKMVALTAAHLVWTGLAVVYLEMRTRAPSSEFGFDLGRLAYDVKQGLLGFLAALVPVYGSLWVVRSLFPQSVHPLEQIVEDSAGGAGGGLFGVVFISAVIAAPLAEELVFRVILQGWLERKLEEARQRRGGTLPRGAEALPILASATAFAGLHQGFEVVALFVLALFLGYLYRQTHRIYASWVVHVIVNTLAVISLSGNL
jgi:membrane protease YdiL (CAAX protease family)